MRISVVIPTYNEEERIKDCLDSLLRQTRNADEIIVVDNNSNDRTNQIVKKFMNVKLIKQKKTGIIPTRNLGFDTATGEIIARCDADTTLPVDWLERIEDSFRENPSAAAVSNPVLLNDIKFADKPKWLFYVYMFIPKIFIGHYPLVGPSMAVSKAAWIKIRKNLCEDPIRVHEDLDLSFHIKKIGPVIHDSNNLVLTSGRRLIHNPKSFFFEYTWRFFKMLPSHLSGL